VSLLKKLSELYDVNEDVLINEIKTNSREIQKGDMFVCIKGIGVDRHDFIDEAIENGASCLMVERKGDYKVPAVKVENANVELGLLSKKFYDDPLKSLKLIGITGTDGKTTTASIIRNMLGNKKCGYIGTNGIYCLDEIIDDNNTTPEINKTYKYLNKFVNKGLDYATMEMSSEALLHNRTNTLELDIAVLTNITEDHLNAHKNIENYILAKEKIFDLLKPNAIAILNRDDKYYDRISSKIKNKQLTYGKNLSSDLVIIEIREYDSGTIFYFGYDENIYKVISPLRGEFNVYNLSASILCLIALGFSPLKAIEAISDIEVVSGRCEFLEFGQNYKIVLDYAHTANGLKNILSYLNKVKKKRIITITGSAGGREKEKRKDMGKVVLELSDLVIFTMDDPRFEDVDEIIDDLVSQTNQTNYLRIINREEAIRKALAMAEDDDIILVAGKGRDQYMAVKDQYLSYCDYDVILDYFSSFTEKK